MKIEKQNIVIKESTIKVTLTEMDIQVALLGIIKGSYPHSDPISKAKPEDIKFDVQFDTITEECEFIGAYLSIHEKTEEKE